MRKPITIEDYLAAGLHRRAASPLRLLPDQRRRCRDQYVAERDRAKKISSRAVTIEAVGRADMR